ncbi:MAG: hypothetical protein GXO75_07405, partial [Calditrichaeota bacterium]|nr:hypothetical protein [Calditrichota bacterium]
MDFYLSNLSSEPYKIAEPQLIPTPRLLLFRDRLEENITQMKQLLKAINPSYDLRLL